MNSEFVGVGNDVVEGGGEYKVFGGGEEFEIDPVFDYECIMIVANALRTPIYPYYGKDETMTGGQGKRTRQESEDGRDGRDDEDPSNEISPEVVELAVDILNRAAAAAGSTSQKVRVSKDKKIVRARRQRQPSQQRPSKVVPDEAPTEQLLIGSAGKRLREERPTKIVPDAIAGRDYAMAAAEGALGPSPRRLLLNAVQTILTTPGALRRFYDRYQRYINYGINFVGLTDLARPNSIIIATITALIQTIAEFIPTPSAALGGLVNTGVNLATILYQALPLLLPGLIAYGCATAGEALVHGTIKRARMAVSDPLGTVREVTGRIADIRDLVGRMLAQGPALFFGNIAVGALNTLMDAIDPTERFHRFVPRGEGQPALDAAQLVPTTIPDGNIDEIRMRINDLIEPPAATTGEPADITPEEKEALLALLQLAEEAVVLEDQPEKLEGGKKKRRRRTAKNKRSTPRRRKMSKKNLRRRY
jgi:hypothetical protein